ncbi:MAG: hypothetical protein ACOZAJ_01930, partial [Patescibacteria group bacterium]
MDLQQGLKLIEELKLPHPDWRFVTDKKDLEGLSKVLAYAGWTIRTIKVLKGNYKNYYANWLSLKRLSSTLVDFQKKLKHKGLFIVYPSWRWRKGGTLLVDKQGFIVEATKGQIADLARHGQVQARYTGQLGKNLRLRYGQNIISRLERKHLNQAAAVIAGLPMGEYYGE